MYGVRTERPYLSILKRRRRLKLETWVIDFFKVPVHELLSFRVLSVRFAFPQRHSAAGMTGSRWRRIRICDTRCRDRQKYEVVLCIHHFRIQHDLHDQSPVLDQHALLGGCEGPGGWGVDVPWIALWGLLSDI